MKPSDAIYDNGKGVVAHKLVSREAVSMTIPLEILWEPERLERLCEELRLVLDPIIMRRLGPRP